MSDVETKILGSEAKRGRPRVLFLDPYHAGAHAAFSRRVTEHVSVDWTLLTLPGRHWKWRMRGSALWFASQVESSATYDAIVATSYVPIAELRGLMSTHGALPIAVYFHENQLTYPVQEAHSGERDHHFGMTQILSAWSADAVWFNSAWNRDSFLGAAAELLSRLPDAVPPGVVPGIRDKSEVLPVPVDMPASVRLPVDAPDPLGPLVLWNHRWEYDKAPDVFFDALGSLRRKQVPFRVAVCGQRFRKAPVCFATAERELADRVVHWGFAERARYLELLQEADVSVSTAIHEFFGVAAIEAAAHGAYPLVPDRLAYPEWFAAEHRYASGAFAAGLEALCARYAAGERLRADRRAAFEAARTPVACGSIARALGRLLDARV